MYSTDRLGYLLEVMTIESNMDTMASAFMEASGSRITFSDDSGWCRFSDRMEKTGDAAIF